MQGCSTGRPLAGAALAGSSQQRADCPYALTARDVQVWEQLVQSGWRLGAWRLHGRGERTGDRLEVLKWARGRRQWLATGGERPLRGLEGQRGSCSRGGKQDVHGWL
eukprot:scaffold278923_cov19-Prasinocladus_malaysianus.AAC.1